jgi:YD repeat-containing protein
MMQAVNESMSIRPRHARMRLGALIFFAFAALVPTGSIASAIYTYDQVGRLTTALYDNGVCVAYAYDANGNRTSQINTLGGTPASPIWGSGVWGCFSWTPH